MRIYITLFALLLLGACQTQSGGQNQSSAPSPSVEEQPLSDSIVHASYVSCTVYAASTDYYFDSESGEQITFRVTYGDSLPVLPDFLMESSDTLEGVPGPNPGVVGEDFQLIYRDEQLIEVRLTSN